MTGSQEFAFGRPMFGRATRPPILASGQSQFTDMVGGKPLGLTIAWINRRGLDLDPSVPPPDLILSGLQPLCGLLGDDGAIGAGRPPRCPPG